MNRSGRRSRRGPRGRQDAQKLALSCRELIAAGYNPQMPTSTLKHNTYFDGNVQSIGYERHGRRATVGVIAPGEYHFGTEAPERMSVLSGEIAVKADGGGWANYAAGTAFEISGRSGFDVRASQPAAYLCEFL